MTERFRPAKPEEVPDLARLVGHSFIGRTQEQREEMLARGPLGGLETVWVGEDGGRPHSLCMLLSLQQWIAGVRVPTMGLALVTVSPAHRRRRVAGRLVATGLREARERGDLASALYPFRAGFYEDLGYGLAGEAHQYLLPPQMLPDAPERALVRLVERDEDHQALRGVYERWAPGETGQLERGDGHWQRIWQGDDRASVLYRDESGEPEAYAIVNYRSDLAGPDRFLEVEERAWLTPTGRRAIYAWLASLGDQWTLLAYRAHPDERFGSIVREPRLPARAAPNWGLWFPSATLMAGPMFRLLDVPRAWAVRRVAADAAVRVTLEVRDPQIPENDGSWHLRLEGGGVEVEPSPAGRVDATLRLPVSVLSALFIGAMATSTAVAAGLAETDRPDALAALDTALRVRRPWTFDRF